MNILAISGSLREASLNRKLLKHAVRMCTSAGSEVQQADLRDYPLPAYDGDIQDSRGILEEAQKFSSLLSKFKILVISSPEYNYSMPGHFKNTFDWVSRIKPMPWTGKIVLMMSASPSNVGGNRGLWSLRVPFEGCGAIVYPEMFSLFQADDAFDETGNFKDPKNNDRLGRIVKDFLAFAANASGEGGAK